MGNNAGHAADNFLNSFMRGYGFMEQMRTQRQSEADRKEDRAYMGGQRARQVKQQAFQDATQPTVGEVKQSRSNTLKGQELNLDIARTKLKGAKQSLLDQEGQRDLASAWMLAHPDSGPMDDAAAEKVFNTSKKYGIPIEGIMSPKFRQANDTLMQLVQGAPISHEKAMEAFNTRFYNDINKGADTLPNGDKIISRRAVNGYLTKDHEHLAVELEVTAQKKDGSGTYKYKAMGTKNRSGETDDPVLFIPTDAVMDKIHGARLFAQALDQSPKAKESLERFMRAKGIQYGADVSTGGVDVAGKGGRGKGGSGGAQLALAQAMASADPKKYPNVARAIEYLKTNPDKGQIDLMRVLTAQKDDLGNPRYTETQVKDLARQYVQSVVNGQLDQPAAAAAAGGADREALLAEAEAAIADGADPEAVRARLRDDHGLEDADIGIEVE